MNNAFVHIIANQHLHARKSQTKRFKWDSFMSSGFKVFELCKNLPNRALHHILHIFITMWVRGIFNQFRMFNQILVSNTYSMRSWT